MHWIISKVGIAICFMLVYIYTVQLMVVVLGYLISYLHLIAIGLLILTLHMLHAYPSSAFLVAKSRFPSPFQAPTNPCFI